MTGSALVALSILVGSWILYPLGLRLMAHPRSRARWSALPPITALVVTRDAPAVIAGRVDNLREAAGVFYEEILVVLDWTIRNQADEYVAVLGERARIVIGDAPGGKAAGLNAGMREATGACVLLADSWQTYEPDAVRRLLKSLADGTYSAASGRVVHEHDDLIMRIYWWYENHVRAAQSSRHSLVTTSGAISVVQRAAWTPLPAGAICDDLFITLGMAMSGHRVAYVPRAIARDSRVLTKRQLYQKKVRTLTGLWQLLAWRPRVLVPWRNPLWLDFICHKLARLATPYLVLVTLAGALALLLPYIWPPRTGWLLAVVLLAAPLALAHRSGLRIAALALWVSMLLVAPVVATYNGLRRDWGVWKHHTVARGVGPGSGTTTDSDIATTADFSA